MRVKNVVVLMVLCCLAFSCRTVRQVTVKKDIPFITENKLLRNIDSNELKYNTLFIKRIDVSYTNKKESSSFKASMKIKRDTFIQVSVTAPLGIEVARVLITPDSIKFADIYHKKYFIAGYDYFYEKFDIHLNFDCIQDILTNIYFNIEDYSSTGRTKKFKLERTDAGYELSSVQEKALSRKIKKLYKKKRKNKDYVLILQKILIDPVLFRPLQMSVEDVDEDMGVAVSYGKFKDFSGKIFPEKIVFKLFSEGDKINLELTFLKLEFDVPVESNFKISSKYKRIE